MLHWFSNDRFPLYLAPMAGVTDVVFRGMCKELGADVMVTEFVSAEGILQRDDRTRHYTEFDEAQRPIGVQLFGSDGVRRPAAMARWAGWLTPRTAAVIPPPCGRARARRSCWGSITGLTTIRWRR